MKKRLLFWASLILSLTLTAQNLDYDNSILINARNEGDDLFLDWLSYPSATSYFIKKREKGQSAYKALVNLPGNALSYTDTAVVKGKIYEYHITRQTSTSNIGAAIAAGIEAAPVHQRGGVVLIVENGIAQALPDELTRYQNDLTEEGWTVWRLAVFSTSAPDSIKAALKSLVAGASPIKIESIVLIGKVPVPYAGNLAPDGHTPDHMGAWPADVYYAELDGSWTDNVVNVTGATGTRNDNVPGDGKFDNSSIPSKVELACGRIDLSDLPAFPEGEISLMRKYFDKNHQFRKGQTPYVRRGLIENNFASYPEAFGQSGLNNFCRFFGRDSVKYLPYKSTLQTNSYLFSYGCGSGHYQGALGIGTTSELVNENHLTTFTLIFGSYFGDWHNTNNYLRAPLASGRVLTNAWAGRPVWHLHHMAMGETIGYGCRITQNNSSEFNAGSGATGVHIALMGDPTLTLLPYEGIDTFYAKVIKDSLYLNWEGLTSEDQSYYVYQKKGNGYELITPVAIKETLLGLGCVKKGSYEFMVRPVRLETTGSGSFYNLGGGKSLTATIEFDSKPDIKIDYSLFYEKMDITAEIIDGKLISFDAGDGRIFYDSIPATLVYPRAGTFYPCFKLGNLCTTKDTCIEVSLKSSSPIHEIFYANPKCYDEKGYIFIHEKQDALPFTFVWSTLDTTLSIGGLGSGNYSITITTVSGWTDVLNFTLTAPDPITAAIEVIGASENQNNGKIIIDQLKGWNFSYKVFINDVNYNTQLVYEGLAPGDYTIKIVDASMCTLDTTVKVNVISHTIDTPHSADLLIQTMNGGWEAVNKDEEEKIKIHIYDLAGRLLRRINFKDWDQQFTNDLPAGIYPVVASFEHRQQTLKWIHWK